MFSKIFKILKESISSVTNANQWETITRDMLKQGITGYKPMVRDQPVDTFPKYSKGQLVQIRFHQRWPHLHKEVGIIVEVHDYDSFNKHQPVFFYEILVGEEKITLIERFLDGIVSTEEESST